MSHIVSGCFRTLAQGFMTTGEFTQFQKHMATTATFTQGAWIWCESLLKTLGNFMRFLLGF